ncbi:MAG: hypothetical protein ABI432_09625 [Flavobacteriales bacterium]
MKLARLTRFAGVIACFVAASTHGQVFSITQPAITSCSGILYDSGGSSADYGNNENYTTVICPDAPEGTIYLVFYQFDLSVDGSPDDALAIYDGNSTAAPFLGSYTAQQLFNLIVTASTQNTSGCLTLVFTSNGAGVGNFSAGIGCVIPCAPPTASFTTSLGDTAVLCLGDTLFVDGSGSQAAPGQALATWTWNITGQGPNTSNDPFQGLVFTEPGIHLVHLVVVDSSFCASDPSQTAVILVSGITSFAGTTATSPVCVPGNAVLVGNAQPVEFVGTTASGADYGPGIYLPDDVGLAFHSVANINWAEPGAVVNDASELGDICLDIEHSFMGDLLVELECPNGQSVILYQQGGGGTYLGDANDTDSNTDPVPGTCWTYCFNTNPDHGTWVECASTGSTPNVMPTSTGVALIPGSYTPVQPLSNFVGCPVNGTWTLTIVDLWGADNGFLCSWGLGSLPSIDSTFFDLSPQLYLEHPDSAFWSGVDVINTDGPNAVTGLSTEGDHDLVFTIIDSYGCYYDTTLTVVGLNYPIVDAGPDLEICDEPVQMNGEVTLGSPVLCTYELVLYNDLTGWSDAYVTLTIDGVATSYGDFTETTLTIPVEIQDGSSIELGYSGLENAFSYGFYFYGPQGEQLYSSGWAPFIGVHYEGVAECGVPPGSTASWSPATGLSDPSDPSTMITPPASGWYVLTAYRPDGACPASDSVWVGLGGGWTTLQWDTATMTLCCDTVGLASYDWFHNGSFYATTSSNCYLPWPTYGGWTVVAQPDTGCPLFSVTEFVCPVIAIEQFGTVLGTTQGLGTYAWSYNGFVIAGETSFVTPILGAGLYTVTVTMGGGCIISASMDITVGMVDMAGSNGMTISPNPNTGSMRLNIPYASGQRAAVEITDVTGRLVWTAIVLVPPSGFMEVLELGLTAGTYTVRASSHSGSGCTRMVIE